MLILSATSGNNLDLARAFAAEAESQNLSVDLISLPELPLPLYDSVNQEGGNSEGLLKLAKALRDHKSMVVCAPEYNGSIPPVVSNAIAWLSVSTEDFRALFNGRPVALATHSGGGGQKVCLAMRQQLAHLGCTVLGREVTTKPANPEAIAAIVSQLSVLESSYVGVSAKV